MLYLCRENDAVKQEILFRCVPFNQPQNVLSPSLLNDISKYNMNGIQKVEHLIIDSFQYSYALSGKMAQLEQNRPTLFRGFPCSQ